MPNSASRTTTFLIIIFLFTVLLSGVTQYETITPRALAEQPTASNSVAGQPRANGPFMLFLPVLSSHRPVRRINAPHFGEVWDGGSAVSWFGRVMPTENYADIRVAYTDSELYVRVNIIDRRLWYNTNPLRSDLTLWDAVALYLNLNGNRVTLPDADSYRFVAQLNYWESPRTDWQASFRGNGSGWSSYSVPFTTETGWRGNRPNDDTEDDNGWDATFHIPFASLGLPGPPPLGTTWGMGIVLHDRDDAAGTPIPSQIWPEWLDVNRPSTWAQLSFGLPAPYVAAPATRRSTATIRNGLNGVVVPDGEVGGGFLCGTGLDVWTTWGNKNYAGQQQINIQNQIDIADWPCFSKYYISFPLDSLPSGKIIISATLTLFQFGNSGQCSKEGTYPSLIQVLTVFEGWTEGALSWNNAPLAEENVSQATVDPIRGPTCDYVPPWPGIPRTWDVTSAVNNAYTAGQPLHLVLYSADAPMHSGKYFYSSDADPEGRPTLTVTWGDP